MAHAGLKALASLRMEKGYRDYGHDIDNSEAFVTAFRIASSRPIFEEPTSSIFL
jgi:4-methylaminobutanoate oxidase (formaldehyde-forming)